MKGYWNDKTRTEEVRLVERIVESDGSEGEKVWMHTGDEAEMDEQGYVKITGRIKDLIIRGGENIHPLEVENCLFGMGEVKEVSVVGLGDERYGECVAAFVVVHGGVRVGVDDAGVGDKSLDETQCGNGTGKEEEKGGDEGEMTLTKDKVRDWVRGKLSNHLAPKYVFWIDEYPKTASGKIQKFRLREMGEEILKKRV